ncbi:hypothetical protein ARMGADRAFT_1080486 [Armillaria gallica]|uniref:Uncharacterized protein n=1 Tax=Armillaria gallica TaxID=47427 RepID=A0A2H3DTG8_ARMGA|nr:hypothetical protein ARMGADRAFT_1080486 [Armillaria gallica]
MSLLHATIRDLRHGCMVVDGLLASDVLAQIIAFSPRPTVSLFQEKVVYAVVAEPSQFISQLCREHSVIMQGQQVIREQLARLDELFKLQDDVCQQVEMFIAEKRSILSCAWRPSVDLNNYSISLVSKGWRAAVLSCDKIWSYIHIEDTNLYTEESDVSSDTLDAQLHLRVKNRMCVCFLPLCDSLRYAPGRVQDIYLCQGGVPEADDDLVVDAVVKVALGTLLVVKVDLRAGPSMRVQRVETQKAFSII